MIKLKLRIVGAIPCFFLGALPFIFVENKGRVFLILAVPKALTIRGPILILFLALQGKLKLT